MRRILIALSLALASVAVASGQTSDAAARAELNAGAREYRAGNYAAAEEHFRRALELDPTQKDVRLFIARAILGALGREMYVENENMIDMATALSATGPTYIFMMMEALVDAGVHMGFSRHVAEELVTQTMLGSVLFARETHKHPAELRNMVTSPGGTSAEAIYQMEKGSLRTVLSKAVYAAYQRAVALGRK